MLHLEQEAHTLPEKTGRELQRRNQRSSQPRRLQSDSVAETIQQEYPTVETQEAIAMQDMHKRAAHGLLGHIADGSRGGRGRSLESNLADRMPSQLLLSAIGARACSRSGPQQLYPSRETVPLLQRPNQPPSRPLRNSTLQPTKI